MTGTVTVRLDDLRALLDAADYVNNRSLIGPVDRMGDAVALAQYAAEAPADPDAGDVAALLAGVDWMDLWWQMTGDDWPVPDDFPGKFARIVVNRLGLAARDAEVRRTVLLDLAAETHRMPADPAKAAAWIRDRAAREVTG